MTLTNISPFIEVTHQLLNTHYREDKIYKKNQQDNVVKTILLHIRHFKIQFEARAGEIISQPIKKENLKNLILKHSTFGGDVINIKNG